MSKEYEAASLHWDAKGVLSTENQHHGYQSSPETFQLIISTGNMPQRAETGNTIVFFSFYIQAHLSNMVIFNLKASVGASRMVILDPIRSAFWTYSRSDIRASDTMTRRQQRTKLPSFLSMVISFRRQIGVITSCHLPHVEIFYPHLPYLTIFQLNLSTSHVF